MLLDQLTADLAAAMKARQPARVAVIRHVLAQLKNARIAKGDDLSDEDVIQVMKKGVKTRQESVEMYRTGGRADLAEQEEAEIEVLNAYLPEQLTGEALRSAVAAVVASTGATSMREMGAVMKAVMAELGGRADGKAVQAVVRELLS